jgi:hypothetical protein
LALERHREAELRREVRPCEPQRFPVLLDRTAPQSVGKRQGRKIDAVRRLARSGGDRLLERFQRLVILPHLCKHKPELVVGCGIPRKSGDL